MKQKQAIIWGGTQVQFIKIQQWIKVHRVTGIHIEKFTFSDFFGSPK